MDVGCAAQRMYSPRSDHARGRRVSTQPSTATIIGGPASPFVRKVLAVCEMKGVPYRLDPIVPFFGNDEFGDISPLAPHSGVDRRPGHPVRQHGDLRVPGGALSHAVHAARRCGQRAQARWLEEFSDTRMGRRVHLARVLPGGDPAVHLPEAARQGEDRQRRGRAGAGGDGLSGESRARRRLSRPRGVDRQISPSPFPSATSGGRGSSPTRRAGPRLAPGSRAPKRRPRSPR